MDPANIPFATCLTLLGLLGLLMASNDKSLEVIRYAGVLFLFPIMYYFTHPEPYHLRPLDPLLVILGCYALLALRERLKASATLRRGSQDDRGAGNGLGKSALPDWISWLAVLAKLLHRDSAMTDRKRSGRARLQGQKRSRRSLPCEARGLGGRASFVVRCSRSCPMDDR